MRHEDIEQIKLLIANPGLEAPLLKILNAMSAGAEKEAEAISKTLTDAERRASLEFFTLELQKRKPA